MNKFSTLQPQPGHWGLVSLSQREQRKHMLACIATLALEESVVVLDGGMLFNVYRVIMASHGQTHILNRIRFARAFTCYQMVALLERTSDKRAYVMVLDLLSTFQDENVPASERIRLLKICLPHLTRLSRARGALVSVGLLEGMSPDTQPLFRLLEKQATQVYEWSIPAIPEQAARLF
jgi:hypothetical protein